jgi:DNA topoisomerase-1
MIIYRKGLKDKWVYEDTKGLKIKDPLILEYIKKLVIPPAYRDVEIFYVKAPKILFQGFDDKDRLQQIYSKQWRAKADKEKFISLIEFGKKMPQMCMKMLDNIKSNNPVMFKDKLISIILRITLLCGFRIGQLKYQKLYNSVGLSTLKKKHLKFNGSRLDIKFIGKKGVLNECIVEDKLLIQELKRLTDNIASDSFIFVYNDSLTKESRLINAIDVNNWLKSYDPNFTTKFFRTFDVNDRLIDALKQTTPHTMTITQRKKKIVELMKEISCAINNTPAICKKSYINGDLIKLYIDNPRNFKKLIIDNTFSSRINFIHFLEATYKKR